jgi:plastocyanin
MVKSLVLMIPLLAAGATDDELRRIQRELDALKAEVSAMRYTLSEVGRLSRQQAELVERMLRPGEAYELPPPAPPKEPEPRAKASKSTKKPDAPPSLPKPRRVARSNDAPSGGTVSGTIKVPSGEPVAYVYVENITGRLVSGRTVAMEQVSKQLTPGWAVIEKGTQVEFPNGDNIYHNVFSRSPGNTFDLGMYRKGESKSHRFIKAGPVDVFCNIHPRMAASILVVPNRYFAKVQKDGSFVIPNVPPGRRKIVAWAPGSEVASSWVEVAQDGNAAVQLELVSKSGGHSNKHGRPYGSYP